MHRSWGGITIKPRGYENATTHKALLRSLPAAIVRRSIRWRVNGPVDGDPRTKLAGSGGVVLFNHVTAVYTSTTQPETLSA